MSDRPVILFAGGGSGGHIYPNVAVAERLSDAGLDAEPHYLISQRPLDARIISRLQGEAAGEHTALTAQPLRRGPGGLWRFYRGYAMARRQVRELIAERRVAALVATGGFVSGPAVRAARRAGVPVALVNLDAVPGKANRFSARHATAVFTTYAHPTLSRAALIGMPLRREVTDAGPAAEARLRLGLDPARNTLLVFAGSQGSASINRTMIELCSRGVARELLAGWQVLYAAGRDDRPTVQQAYDDAGVSAKVLEFCQRMGDAWAASDLALCNAGAGSVAEAWANAVPAIFYPYPYHRDQHQRLNARPLIDADGAMLLTDHLDPLRNVDELLGPLKTLLGDQSRRERMRQALIKTRPENGAIVVAHWLATNARL